MTHKCGDCKVCALKKWLEDLARKNLKARILR